MAQSVLIIAESGCGKSTAIESLNPAETFIINVANKPLPFRGWKTKYPSFDISTKKGNLASVHKSTDIEGVLKIINNERKEIKNIVIDDCY
jgi:ABC-type phosphate transport system ATPase subunit